MKLSLGPRMTVGLLMYSLLSTAAVAVLAVPAAQETASPFRAKHRVSGDVPELDVVLPSGHKLAHFTWDHEKNKLMGVILRFENGPVEWMFFSDGGWMAHRPGPHVARPPGQMVAWQSLNGIPWPDQVEVRAVNAGFLLDSRSVPPAENVLAGIGSDRPAP